jgi:hypothetical protein
MNKKPTKMQPTPAPKVDLKNSGYPEKDVKTTGIKIRGTGAATKGVMARGPMA